MERAAEVWLLATGGLGPEEVAAAEALLDPETRARAARLRLFRDRRDLVMAHALLRRALSARLPGTPPAAWRIERAPGGRPRLAGGGPGISLAHARGLVACALAPTEALGVDAEAPACAIPEALEEAALHPAERAALAALPGEARARAFLRLWTLKEALLKASGAGLREPPAGFGFTLDPVALLPGGAFPPRPEAWAFAERETDGGFRAAVALPLGLPVIWREAGWPAPP